MNSFEQPTTSRHQDGTDTETLPAEATGSRFENLPGIPPYAAVHREAQAQQFAEAERLREEIRAIAKDQQAAEQPADVATPEQGTLHPYVETYTEYTKCEVCLGSGRRLLFFRCPACGGRGSTPASTSMKTGYYVSERTANAAEENGSSVTEPGGAQRSV